MIRDMRIGRLRALLGLAGWTSCRLGLAVKMFAPAVHCSAALSCLACSAASCSRRHLRNLKPSPSPPGRLARERGGPAERGNKSAQLFDSRSWHCTSRYHSARAPNSSGTIYMSSRSSTSQHFPTLGLAEVIKSRCLLGSRNLQRAPL